MGTSTSIGTGGVRVAGLPEQAVIGEPLAEAAVLGCLLRGRPEQARSVLDVLDQDCWSVPQHAHVAAAARALLARGEPVDPVTVLGSCAARAWRAPAPPAATPGCCSSSCASPRRA